MKNKRYEDLTFTDDFMFCKILSTNESLCQELLEMILSIKIKKIVFIHKQQEISITADAKSVRLDVYVEDDDNSVYDIEMAEFLRYLRDGIGNSPLVQKIDQAVVKAREHREWRTEYMSLQLKFYDIWDEARDDGLEAGLAQGRAQGHAEGRIAGCLETLFNLVHDGLLSIDDAYKRTQLTRDEFIHRMNEFFSN